MVVLVPLLLTLQLEGPAGRGRQVEGVLRLLLLELPARTEERRVLGRAGS